MRSSVYNMGLRMMQRTHTVGHRLPLAALFLCCLALFVQGSEREECKLRSGHKPRMTQPEQNLMLKYMRGQHEGSTWGPGQASEVPCAKLNTSSLGP